VGQGHARRPRPAARASWPLVVRWPHGAADHIPATSDRALSLPATCPAARRPPAAELGILAAHVQAPPRRPARRPRSRFAAPAVLGVRRDADRFLGIALLCDRCPR